jgi:hypothetical protein
MSYYFELLHFYSKRYIFFIFFNNKLTIHVTIVQPAHRISIPAYAIEQQ